MITTGVPFVPNLVEIDSVRISPSVSHPVKIQHSRSSGFFLQNIE